MSDEEFAAAMDAILEGVPGEAQLTRLEHLVRVLVEVCGAPAVDVLRSVVQLRHQVEQTGPRGDPTGDHLQDISQ